MADQGFARLVSLACHDLRTPLATVNGFAKTLTRGQTLGEREAHFVDLIESAADQMTALLDLLGLAARIESGRYEPALAEANTLDLVADGEGRGETIETDAQVMRRALDALAHCAAVHGGGVEVSWKVDGRKFVLSPLTQEAAPVITGESPRDLGALVARLAIEALGGSLAVDGETLVVSI
ncbi:MAG TPA: histidine kinase dimerization/phospho-acceptor domain-containing protein [Gaiellaceae bacterium]|jgi:hypothetical protein